jgi:hypothetical protein
MLYTAGHPATVGVGPRTSTRMTRALTPGPTPSTSYPSGFGLLVHLDFVGPGAGEAFAGPFAGGVYLPIFGP